MAEEQPRADAPAASAERPRGRGRGFIAGLVGGVLGAGGSIYALQYPQVRENLPLPQEADLIVSPEAVARINALEAELAQVRDVAREAEETAAVDTVVTRVDQLSSELNTLASVDQLEALRTGLSPLADPEGAAALGERLQAMDDALTTLSETTARAEALATVEAAVQGFEARVGGLEQTRDELVEAVATLQETSTALESSTTELTDRAGSLETGLVERTAAVTGRVDAFARDIANLREAIGAGEARLARMRETTAAELKAMGERVDGIDASTGTALGDVAALEQQLAEATDASTTHRADLDDAFQALTTRLDAAAAAAHERAAAAEAQAQAATDTAGQASAQVAQALARTQTAVGIRAAATDVDRALATGGPVQSALARLEGLDTSALDADEAGELRMIADTLDRYADGVPSAAALQLSLTNLRPALIEAATQQNDGEGGLMSAFNLRARTEAGEIETKLDEAHKAIAGDDLAGAVAAVEALPEVAAGLAEPWLAEARERLAVSQARGDLLNLGRDLAAAASAS